MDGPVLSGGVVVAVAALLWLLYLLPSWRGRHQFYAAERNAVRLNQALRILAETSEMPGEVRAELNARSAHAQQKLARRVQAEHEAAQLEMLRVELAATRADPLVRQARARRRVRQAATTVLVVGGGLIGVGVWQAATSGGAALVWVGSVLAVLGAFTLYRMSRVAVRAVRRAAEVPVASARERVAPPLHDQGPAPWTPRPLPQPLTSVEGSQAHAAQARADAQRARREAAHAEELRRRAEKMAPPAPTQLPVPAPAAAPAASATGFAAMGYVDDAEIEAHVRQLLARRATG